MFAEAYRLSNERLDRRMAEINASFDHRLAHETGRLRLTVVEQLAALRADLLKWSFLFWLGQFAAVTALLSFMLNGR